MNTTQALRALMMSSTLVMVQQRRRKRCADQLSLQNMRPVPVLLNQDLLCCLQKKKKKKAAGAAAGATSGNSNEQAGSSEKLTAAEKQQAERRCVYKTLAHGRAGAHSQPKSFKCYTVGMFMGIISCLHTASPARSRVQSVALAVWKKTTSPGPIASSTGRIATLCSKDLTWCCFWIVHPWQVPEGYGFCQARGGHVGAAGQCQPT